MSIEDQWNPQNPCFSCGGQCCQDTRIPLSDIPYVSQDFLFGALEPHVINPNQPIDLNIVPLEQTGVHYAVGKKHTYLVIVGKCPLLLGTGECSAHAQQRPLGCTTSQVGMFQKCISSKREQHLSEV